LFSDSFPPTSDLRGFVPNENLGNLHIKQNHGEQNNRTGSHNILGSSNSKEERVTAGATSIGVAMPLDFMAFAANMTAMLERQAAMLDDLERRAAVIERHHDIAIKCPERQESGFALRASFLRGLHSPCRGYGYH
jgi:hypothetical protein